MPQPLRGEIPERLAAFAHELKEQRGIELRDDSRLVWSFVTNQLAPGWTKEKVMDELCLLQYIFAHTPYSQHYRSSIPVVKHEIETQLFAGYPQPFASARAFEYVQKFVIPLYRIAAMLSAHPDQKFPVTWPWMNPPPPPAVNDHDNEDSAADLLDQDDNDDDDPEDDEDENEEDADADADEGQDDQDEDEDESDKKITFADFVRMEDAVRQGVQFLVDVQLDPTIIIPGVCGPFEMIVRCDERGEVSFPVDWDFETERIVSEDGSAGIVNIKDAFIVGEQILFEETSHLRPASSRRV